MILLFPEFIIFIKVDSSWFPLFNLRSLCGLLVKWLAPRAFDSVGVNTKSNFTNLYWKSLKFFFGNPVITNCNRSFYSMSMNLCEIWILSYFLKNFLTLFKIEGPKKPPTSSSAETFTNVGIRPQNILTFSFNTSVTLV